MANLVAMGCGNVRPVGLVGDDPWGREILRLLAELGVGTADVLVQEKILEITGLVNRTGIIEMSEGLTVEDLIVLAGYLKLYSPPPALRRNVLNIHPSLIPSFCGAGFYGHHVHEAVKARGCKVSGCTVHFANEVYDEGPIVVQKCVSLTDEDTPDDIAARVFAAECEAYPEAINLVERKGINYFWDRVQK